jgi:hypothetical protein
MGLCRAAQRGLLVSRDLAVRNPRLKKKFEDHWKS